MNAAEIKAARNTLGVSQSGLADLLGVHPVTVSNWERGVLTPTTWQGALLRALAKSPRASEVHAHYQAAGLAAALSVGLEHALTKGGEA